MTLKELLSLIINPPEDEIDFSTQNWQGSIEIQRISTDLIITNTYVECETTSKEIPSGERVIISDEYLIYLNSFIEGKEVKSFPNTPWSFQLANFTINNNELELASIVFKSSNVICGSGKYNSTCTIDSNNITYRDEINFFKTKRKRKRMNRIKVRIYGR